MHPHKKERIEKQHFYPGDLTWDNNRHLDLSQRAVMREFSRHREDHHTALTKTAEILAIKYDVCKTIVERVRLKKMIAVVRVNNSKGQFITHYVPFKEPKTEQFLLEFAQSIDWDRVEAVMNKQSPMPDQWPPQEMGPSKYQFSINAKNLISRKMLKTARKRYQPQAKPENAAGPTNTDCQVIYIDDYLEYEKMQKPENTVSVTVAVSTTAVKPAANINTTKPNIKTEAERYSPKTDDDIGLAGISEKMPSDLEFYDSLVDQLEKDGIPRQFCLARLPGIIRFNRKSPPRKQQDWLDWAEKPIRDAWDRQTLNAEIQAKKRLEAGIPIPIPSDFEYPAQNLALASGATGLEPDLITQLFDEFKTHWLDTGGESLNWIGRFDSYLWMIAENGGGPVPIEWSRDQEG